MKDKRVTDEDLKQFTRDESARAILEVKDLADEEVKNYRDETIVIEPMKTMLSRDRYNSDFETKSDMSAEMTVEDLIDIFTIRKVEDLYLVRADYDNQKMIELKKDWFVKIATDLGWNKTKRDSFWRELISFDFETLNMRKVELQLSNDDLTFSKTLTPSIDEIIDHLTHNEITALQIKQILFSIAIGQRLEDRVILISGHRTRKKLFMQVLKSISKNRMIKSSLKKLQKDSFEKLISRVIYVDSASTENELERLLEEMTSQIVMIEDDKYIGEPSRLVAVQFDRSTIDGLEAKIETLKTVQFVEEAINALENEEDVKTNRYLRRSLEEDDRLQEFLKYLNDIALIGNESLPSAMLYALYLDYCRYRKIASEFKSQSQFSKAISDSLMKYRYILSEKTERVRSVIKSGRFEPTLADDLLETNLHFKDLYEENKASKIFNLRFDLVESSVQNVESAIYNTTEIRLRRLTEQVARELRSDSKMTAYVERYASTIESMISDIIRESTFKTIELTKYLAQEIFMHDAKDVKARLRDVETISRLELTANLRAVLIKDLYLEADAFSSIEKSFRYDQLDKKLIDLLSHRKDTRAKKLLKTFSTTVDRIRKQRVRDNVIIEICKNVRLI